MRGFFMRIDPIGPEVPYVTRKHNRNQNQR